MILNGVRSCIHSQGYSTCAFQWRSSYTIRQSVQRCATRLTLVHGVGVPRRPSDTNHSSQDRHSKALSPRWPLFRRSVLDILHTLLSNVPLEIRLMSVPHGSAKRAKRKKSRHLSQQQPRSRRLREARRLLLASSSRSNSDELREWLRARSSLPGAEPFAQLVRVRA